MEMTELDPMVRAWLAEIGLHTLPELKKVGPAPAFMEIKSRHPLQAGLPILWALAACVLGIAPEKITPGLKEELLLEIIG